MCIASPQYEDDPVSFARAIKLGKRMPVPITEFRTAPTELGGIEKSCLGSGRNFTQTHTAGALFTFRRA